MYEHFEKLLISACKVIFGECDGNLSRHWHQSSSSSYHMKSLLLWLVGEGIDLLNVVKIVGVMTQQCHTWTQIAPAQVLEPWIYRGWWLKRPSRHLASLVRVVIIFVSFCAMPWLCQIWNYTFICGLNGSSVLETKYGSQPLTTNTGIWRSRLKSPEALYYNILHISTPQER